MTRTKLAASLLLLVLWMAPGVVWSQTTPEMCPQIVDTALRVTSELCERTGRNEACYGHFPVEAYPYPDIEEFVFHQEGDIIGLTDLQSMELGAMDPESGFWGVSLMRLQANLPDEQPGQNVTLITFGEVALVNAAAPVSTLEVTPQVHLNVRQRPHTGSYIAAALPPGQAVTATGRLADSTWLRILIPETGDTGWIVSRYVDADGDLASLPVVGANEPYYRSLQAFYFQTGTREAPCEEASESGLLIQTPAGVGEVRFLINEVSVRLGSTAFFQAVPGHSLAIYLLEGWAQVQAHGVIQTLFPGTRVRILLDQDLGAAGAPSAPEPYADLNLVGLPLTLLPRRIQPAVSLTVAETQQRLAALAAAQSLPPAEPTLEPVDSSQQLAMTTSSGVRADLPLVNLQQGPGDVPPDSDGGGSADGGAPPPPPPPPPISSLVATGRCDAGGEYVFDIRNEGTAPVTTTWRVTVDGAEVASGPVSLVPAGAMQARGLYLIGEAGLALDAFGIPGRSQPVITCTLPVVCPTYGPFPATGTWTEGDIDVITVNGNGPVDYRVQGLITSDGDRVFLSAAGTLNDGERLVIEYPPSAGWGPPDDDGNHTAHTTVFLSVSDGRACTTVSHDWGRFW